MDTGVSKSILKLGSVNGCTLINTNDRVMLGGAFNGMETTLGTTRVHLNFGEKFVTEWKFHVINDSESIPCDGILGADYLCDNAIMDCIDKKMYGYDKSTDELIQVSDALGKEKNLSERSNTQMLKREVQNTQVQVESRTIMEQAVQPEQ